MRIRRGPAKGMRWIVGSASHGCWLGTYELAKRNAILRFVEPGMTVFDIGAQAGIYTLLFSRLVGPRGKVFAFEPCPFENRNLLRHVRLNSLSNVVVISAALADRPGLGRFSIDAKQTENSLSSNSCSPLFVPTARLDDLDLPPPDLIKMDIEGGESDALVGAERILRDIRPTIFLALHGEEHRRQCSALLRKHKCALFDIEGRLIDGEVETDEIYAIANEKTGRLAGAPGPGLSENPKSGPLKV